MKIADITTSEPICCAQGRFGEVIVTQGSNRPLRWDGGAAATAAGIDPPESPPACTLDPTDHYHIARIDVARPGAVYYAAPTVQLSGGALDTAKGKPCKAKAYLSQASVNEILVEDGGKYYSKVPNVVLGDSHGKDGRIVASRGLPSTDGITDWSVLSDAGDQSAGQASERTRYPLLGWEVAIPITGNGTFEITPKAAYELARNAPSGTTVGDIYFRTRESERVTFRGTCAEFGAVLLEAGFEPYIRYTVSGFTGTERVLLAIQGRNYQGAGGCRVIRFSGTSVLTYAALGSESVESMRSLESGANVDQDQAIVVVFESLYGEQVPLIIEGYPSGHPLNTAAAAVPISRLEIADPGSGYIVTPQLQIVSPSGFGGYATCTVKDGQIDTVTLENPGGGYKSDPEVRILSGGAEASVVARPHLRGLYQCYYRYIDETPEHMGGPIPSNLSEVAEVDAGEAATSITWAVAAPSGRAKKVELWRTTGNQALTLYRVATLDESNAVIDDYGTGQVDTATLMFTDDLTDEELRNPDRPGYEAMPIVLPNGELNANRFTPPPSKSVVVRFQDRFWYGVGGERPNAVYFSEIDEPESVPEINEIIPQQSGKGSDTLTALIPFGTMLLLMQRRHAYGLTFARQPLLDAQVAPLAYRGCISQRTWDIHDGTLYAMDQSGVYEMSGSGQVASISDAIEDQFRGKISWGASRWSFLAVDPKARVLRAFVAHVDDGASDYPTRALCYSLDSKGWWHESYPQKITGASQASLTDGGHRTVYAAESGAMLLDEGPTDIARGAVLSVLLTSQGSGYRKPPKVSAVGGQGARFQATLDDSGKVSAIWILSCGSGYTSGDLLISGPEGDGEPAAATFVASSLETDTPVSPVCIYRSGFFEYPTDDTDARLGGEQDRSIALSYAPVAKPSEISVRAYYNGSKTPRANLVSRDRGTGVRQDAVDPAARINLAESTDEYGEDVGVAKAMFSGRALADFRGNDRNVATEVIGPSRNDEPLVLYKIEMFGAQK